MEFFTKNAVLLGFTLTALAGLSTGFGSLTAFIGRGNNRAFLAGSLGFSAGVMIYVSFVELFGSAEDMLSLQYRATSATWLTVGGFLGGMLFIALIDFFVPTAVNPHESVLGAGGALEERMRLNRMGLMTALAIGIHNFPEGAATLFATLSDPGVGISIAVAIAIHNIPEGVSIAVPIVHATGSRRQAFWYSFLSGVSEPVGAVMAYAILRPFLSPAVLGLAYASVAGIMVFVSLDQLIPNAKRYDEGHESVYGLIGGMAVMALSLLLM